MIIRKEQDHVIKTSPFCGLIREILRQQDYDSLSIAVVENIKPTTAHYHERFEEIYFMLEGSLTLQLYDPKSDWIWKEALGREGSYELCVIPKGTHHKVIEASSKNVLCVICAPPFDSRDEYKSTRL